MESHRFKKSGRSPGREEPETIRSGTTRGREDAVGVRNEGNRSTTVREAPVDGGETGARE